jgi:hypothetical protein
LFSFIPVRFSKTSMMGLANIPGIAALPMWWMETAVFPNAAAIRFASASKPLIQPGTWGTPFTFMQNAKLTDDEERAKDAHVGTLADRAPRHSVQRFVGGVIW